LDAELNSSTLIDNDQVITKLCLNWTNDLAELGVRVKNYLIEFSCRVKKC